MKRWQRFRIITIILAAIHPAAKAQSSDRDSIHVTRLIATAESFFSDSRYDSALHYCDLAETYSRRQQFRKGAAWPLSSGRTS